MDKIDHWWQRGIIYQIYPRSFLDSNGDGVGDLPGIIARLDYLQWLGLDAIWLSPIFPSPMTDFGYDVSDYTDVHPLFGTLGDFDLLVAAAHERGLKVILDYVPNHSSIDHPWFLEARSARDSAKRDWYIWRDAAADGGPPNNWCSVFGGSAWTWDSTTKQYYYHAYLKEQPDLNWRNKEVQQAMLEVLRFWLDRGVDGFRVDALRQIIKDDLFRDNPANPVFNPDLHSPYQAVLPQYTTDRPEVMDMIALMRQATDAYEQRVLIGELYLSIERLVTYYGSAGEGVHLPFNFHLILSQWDARTIAALIDSYEAALPAHGWPNWVLSNHDKSRLASRVGPAQARIAAMLLVTLRGTPTMYYGDEIGMQDVVIPAEQVHDPFEKNVPGKGLGRDPERTPMQWDATQNAGFTSGQPWLPLADNYMEVNVAVERDDPHSMLNLYRLLITLRRREPAIHIGSYRLVEAQPSVIAFLREHGGKRFLIVLNFGSEAQEFTSLAAGRIALTTRLDRVDEAVRDRVQLRPDEGVIIELD